MKLREIVDRIGELDNELTIYARPEWSSDAESLLAVEPDEGGLPTEAKSAGMTYFLEIFIAKEVLDALQSLDLEGRTNRLIQYAIRDA